jgi:hypothetical protein
VMHKPLTFKLQRGGKLHSGESAITEIFKRAPKGLLAAYHIAVSPKLIYVGMMSVRESWQRQNINTLMMRALKKGWPGRPIEFSGKTPDGAAFAKARRAQLKGLDAVFKRSPDGVVTMDDVPTRGYGLMPGAVIPDENWMYIRLGVAAEMFINLPADTFMVYVFDTEKNLAAYRKYLSNPKATMLLYKLPTGGFLSQGLGPIEEIFSRAPKGLIAVYRVVAVDDKADVHKSWKGVIFVDMMSVRAGWRRQNINTLAIQTFKKNWPGRKVDFSPPTHAGRAFMEGRGFVEPQKPTRIKLTGKRAH